MKKQKDLFRTLAMLLVIALSIGCLSGCGSNAETPTETPTKASAGEPSETPSADEPAETPKETVHLQFWGGISGENGFDQLVAAFNETHDGIQVEYVYYTNDEAGNIKLDMSLMAGGDADLFLSHNDVLLQKRIETGNTLPLNDYLDKYDFDPVEGLGEGITEYSNGGTYYYLPTTAGNNFLMYNKDMFEAAGLELPDESWTYDDFYAAAKALTKDGVYGFYFPAWDAGQPATEFTKRALGENWMYNEDGTAVTIDRPEIRDGFEKYMQRVSEGLEVDFVDNKTQKMTAQDMFLSGKAAMVYAGWIVRYIKDTETYPHDFVTGFAPVPLMLEGQTARYTGGLSDFLSINAKSEHPDEAMEFFYWYLTEGVTYLAEFGRFGAYTGLDRAVLADKCFGDTAYLFDLGSAEKFYLTPGDVSVHSITTASVEINTILTEEFEKAFAGEQSVDEAVTTAQARAEKAFAEALSE